MNIFYLHPNPEVCAKHHCDKHVVKMTLETAQLLSTVHHVLDGDDAEKIGQIYQPTHINHPSAIWARSSLRNYQWLLELGFQLAYEYTHRYGRTHKSQYVIENLVAQPINLTGDSFFEPPQCMPDQYKQFSTVKAYRDYYLGEKSNILQYTNREMPEWMM